MLSTTNELREDLYGHVTEELTFYLYRRFNRILAEVWQMTPSGGWAYSGRLLSSHTDSNRLFASL